MFLYFFKLELQRSYKHGSYSKKSVYQQIFIDTHSFKRSRLVAVHCWEGLGLVAAWRPLHHAPFLLDCQYRLYSLSVLNFFICHYQGLPLPCTTNVISCQYLTLDRVGIEPTTFQSADQASNHYTVDTMGYTLLLCKADMHRSGSRT